MLYRLSHQGSPNMYIDIYGILGSNINDKSIGNTITRINFKNLWKKFYLCSFSASPYLQQHQRQLSYFFSHCRLVLPSLELKRNIQYVLFGIRHLSLSIMFLRCSDADSIYVSSSFIKYHYYSSKVLCCVNNPCIAYSFYWWIAGVFFFFNITNKASMNILYTFCEHTFSFLFGKYLWRVLLGVE